MNNYSPLEVKLALLCVLAWLNLHMNASSPRLGHYFYHNIMPAKLFWNIAVPGMLLETIFLPATQKVWPPLQDDFLVKNVLPHKSNLNFFSLKFYHSELGSEHFFGALVSTLGPSSLKSNCISSSFRFGACTQTTKYPIFSENEVRVPARAVKIEIWSSLFAKKIQRNSKKRRKNPKVKTRKMCRARIQGSGRERILEPRALVMEKIQSKLVS